MPTDNRQALLLQSWAQLFFWAFTEWSLDGNGFRTSRTSINCMLNWRDALELCLTRHWAAFPSVRTKSVMSTIGDDIAVDPAPHHHGLRVNVTVDHAPSPRCRVPSVGSLHLFFRRKSILQKT